MAERFISEKTETGEIIIFDTITKNTHILNATAALVYEQYNKNRSINKIVDIIKKKYPESPAEHEIMCDVEEILRDLRDQKVVN